MPRRIPDYPIIFYGWNHLASIGSYITLTGTVIFIYSLLEACYRTPKATGPGSHNRQQILKDHQPHQANKETLFYKIKKRKDEIFICFVKNEKQQQERFLVVYLICVAVFCFCLYPRVEVFLVFGLILGVVLLLSVVIEKSYQRLESNKTIYILYRIILVGVLLYFQRYTVLCIYLVLLFFYYFKPYFMNKKKECENPNIVVRVFRDLDIIKGHFEKEFRLFNFLQKFNILLLLVICFIYSRPILIWIPDHDIYWHKELVEQVLAILFFFYIVNQYLILCIRHIITKYCNPKTGGGGETTKIIGIAGAAATTVAAALGLHEVVVTNPPHHEIFYRYQEAYYGYRAYDSAQITIANIHKAELPGVPVPVDENNFVDVGRAGENISKQRAINAIHIQAFSDEYKIKHHQEIHDKARADVAKLNTKEEPGVLRDRSDDLYTKEEAEVLRDKYDDPKTKEEPVATDKYGEGKTTKVQVRPFSVTTQIFGEIGGNVPVPDQPELTSKFKDFCDKQKK